MKTTYLFFLSMLFSANLLLADSPITSTPFWEAYQTLPMVKEAQLAKGKITKKIIRYISSNDVPMAEKLCTINALGWQQQGNNADIFQKYLFSIYKVKNGFDLLQKISAEDLICLAYLKANDNYFDVSTAALWATKALERDKSQSFALHVVAALIHAQQAFDVDWCMVFQLTNKVHSDPSLVRDLNAEAMRIIFEYMDLYK